MEGPGADPGALASTVPMPEAFIQVFGEQLITFEKRTHSTSEWSSGFPRDA